MIMMNKNTVKNNRVMKAVLRTDFNKFIEIREIDGKWIGDSKLLSYSTFFKNVSNIAFSRIPKIALSRVSFIGKEVMNMLEYIVKNECRLDRAPYYNDKIRLIVFEIFSILMFNGMKIMACEKKVTNGKWLGVIDLIVRHKGVTKLIEIKTRNGTDLRASDVSQVKVYAAIIGANVESYVWVIDRKTYLSKEYRIKFNDKKELETINNVLRTFQLGEYLLETKPNSFLLKELGEDTYKVWEKKDEKN